MHKPNIKYQLQEHVHQPIRIYIYIHIHITHYVLGDIPYIIGGIAHLLGGMHIQISPIVTIFGEYSNHPLTSYFWVPRCQGIDPLPYSQPENI